MTDSPARETEARRLAVAAILAAMDGRHTDIPNLLADADHETLTIAIGGVAIFAAAVTESAPQAWRAQVRDGVAGWALSMAAWPAS